MKTFGLVFALLAVSVGALSVNIPFGGVKNISPRTQKNTAVLKAQVDVNNSDGITKKNNHFVKETLSGTTVALASIPSSIAFANIAGVDPLIGVWSSIILGATSSLTGMRPGLVSGAAGVVAVPLAKVIQYDKALMGPVVLLAAVMQFAFGALKGGRLINLVSDSVMSGFLNGLGVLLFQSQFKTFMSAGALLPTTELIATGGITALTAALSLALPKLLPGSPTALLSIVGATAVAQFFKLPVACLSMGASTGGGLLPKFVGLPNLVGISAAAWKQVVLPAVFSIGVISILETLLAVKVVDENDTDKDTASEASKNKSLLALGIGNFASCVMGGFGGCGLIPNTLLNLQSGGKGKTSILSYAAVMATSLLLASNLINKVPVASLAGIMILVALRTIQWGTTMATFKSKNVVNIASLSAASIVCYKVDMGSGIILGVLLDKLLPPILNKFKRAPSVHQPGDAM